MKRFSRKYSTFEKWLSSQNKQTDYVRRIIRTRESYPQADLSELSGHGKQKNSLTRSPKVKPIVRSFLGFTQREKENYKVGLGIIGSARRITNKYGERISFDKAFEEFSKSLPKGIDKRTVKRLVNNALAPDGYVKLNDKLERQFILYNKSGKFKVTVKGSDKASLVAKYHNAVKTFRDTGDYSELEFFKGKYVIDIYGKKRYFITDKRLLNYFIQYGETDFIDIYSE